MSEVVRVLERAERPLSTNEVADRVDIDWHTAKKRLDTLVDDGAVHRSEVSNRLTLYWDRKIPF
ncbi:MAG: hypothetical protein ABEI97_05190 [Candidatus Nanohaloarchaea archaeon]